MKHAKTFKFPPHDLLKFFLVSLTGTCFFLILMEIFTPSNTNASIAVPPHWQTLELVVQGIFKAKAGDYVTLLQTDGKIILPKVLLVNLIKKDDSLGEQPAAKWNVEIATPVLNKLQWQELYNLSAENIYLSPLTQEEPKTRIAHQEKIYEISY